MKEPKTTIDELARMVASGFNDMGKRMDERFDKVEKRMGQLEQGQEDIKLRLTNVAYRFELQELQRRVALLEKKAGFAN